jgi:hypothetical protein
MPTLRALCLTPANVPLVGHLQNLLYRHAHHAGFGTSRWTQRSVAGDGLCWLVLAWSGNDIELEPQPVWTSEALSELPTDPDAYLLSSWTRGRTTGMWLVARGPTGLAQAFHRFLYHQGVRVDLHQEILPPPGRGWHASERELRQPLFPLRGLNPWGSHPIGRDAWDVSAWKHYLHQCWRLGLNFVGIHGYHAEPHAEPTVWMGPPEDVGSGDSVRSVYPARYYNTRASVEWGPVRPGRPKHFSVGAARLFPPDLWTASAQQRGLVPLFCDEELADLRLFERAAAHWREVFGYAKELGIRTCLGVEAPLARFAPRAVRERLALSGLDPASPAAARLLYTGMFKRIQQTHPLDYFWLWTPETWTWHPETPRDVQLTLADVHAAEAALADLGHPFKLALTGWVLGPKSNRTTFHRRVPRHIPMSALQRFMGSSPLDPAYAEMPGRELWAMPWLEEDLNLAGPQFWTGRVRKDAADALAYGCKGLIGLHWRTRETGLAARALSEAAWTQTPWNPRPGVLLSDAKTDNKGRPRAVPLNRPAPDDAHTRALPATDLIEDWAFHEAGPVGGPALARAVRILDGTRHLNPLPLNVPIGRLDPDPTPWAKARHRYAFIDRLEFILPKVRDPAHCERLAFWIGQFEFVRRAHEICCRRYALETWLEADPRALRAAGARTRYRALTQAAEALVRAKLHVAASWADWGTLCLLHLHEKWLPEAVAALRRRAEKHYGLHLESLASDYTGPARWITPTWPLSRVESEPLVVSAFFLSPEPPAQTRLLWRPVGESRWQTSAPQPAQGPALEFNVPASRLKGRSVEIVLEAVLQGNRVITCPLEGRKQPVWVHGNLASQLSGKKADS